MNEPPDANAVPTPPAETRQRPWRVVAVAGVFYGGMAGAALLIRLWWVPGEGVFAALRLPDLAVWTPIVAGVVAVTVGTTPWMMRWAWQRRLARDVAVALQTPTQGRAAVLGGVSGFAEELFFRGALQPILGWPVTAVVFGLLHAKGYWWILATAMGVVLGLMTHYSHSLWPAIATHALINAINLWRLPCLLDKGERRV